MEIEKKKNEMTIFIDGFYSRREQPAKLTEKDMQEIVDEFNKNGYGITLKQVKHNYSCWDSDYKSGCVDNGTFLFTPCGCNQLRFTAEHYTGEGYQLTYEA